MRVSYGPPGHKGVSQLMAVGDDEYASPTDQAVKRGAIVAGAAAVIGFVTGSKTAQLMGAGAFLALVGIRLASRRPATAAVTRSASAGYS